jgi:hypothetical protein
LKEVITARQEPFQRLIKGLAEATGFILDSGNKPDVVRILMRNLRLTKLEEGESSYNVLRVMTTLDMAPNPAAFKVVQRIVARVNPKIAQVDLDQILDTSYVRVLESSGFMTELRKKIR